MLNISSNKINKEFDQNRFESLRHVNSLSSGTVLKRLMIFFLGISIIFMFLPWTQNIRANGAVTTLRPDQRPQTIHTIIGGRIEKWFIQEGDFVNKGDTILFISEIKDEYFDSNLLGRTMEQVKSKEFAVKSYMEKVKSLDNRIDALAQTGKLKLEQTRNKLKQAELKILSDSTDYKAASINYGIAEDQYKRLEKLYNDGLKSLTELENRRNKLQEAQAKMISAENKLLTTRNELINAQVELTSIQAQYRDDIAKAESEKYSAMSRMYDAEAVVTKLQNQHSNYSFRSNLYYITSPQSGYITKAIQVGIGETIKEGASIVSIMPSEYALAVELYVKPIDLPLIEKGQDVRIQFDGWPAIVFSGWPNTSYGTYGGKVFAIDNFISENGKFRVLVKPDTSDYNWPKALRIGGGTNNMMLLKEVSVWYELWRNINGFPPDFYKNEDQFSLNNKEK